MAVPLELWTPGMSVLNILHGDDVGTSETKDPSRGMESLSGTTSSVMIWSSYVCARRGGLADENGG